MTYHTPPLTPAQTAALHTLAHLFHTTPSAIQHAIMLHAGVGSAVHSKAWNEAKQLSNIK